MKYCPNCGNQVNENQDVCLNCGVSLKPKNNSVSDTGNVGWALLGFFMPTIGLIIYLIWKDEQPLNAKAAGKGALISVIASAAITALVFIIYFLLIILVVV